MALPRAKLGVSLFRHPCRKPLWAISWGYRPVQARTLAVSRTKSLHDAVTQMADDLYGGFAPATPFLSTIEVFRQSAAVHRLDARLLCYWLFFSKVGVPFA